MYRFIFALSLIVLLPASALAQPQDRFSPQESADTQKAQIDQQMPTEDQDSQGDQEQNFRELGKPQDTPALNVITPRERPPVPVPPPVSLPYVADKHYKNPVAWRIKASGLFKTATPDPTRIYRVSLEGGCEDATKSLTQHFLEEGFAIDTVSPAAGQVMAYLCNPPASQDPGDQPLPVKNELTIMAVKEYNSPENVTMSEIRALVNDKAKVLNMARVRQVLDKTRADNLSKKAI